MDKLRRLLVTTCLLIAGNVFGQLSPGELHKSHAFLEGLENCSKCHGGSRELVADKCLECHAAIKSQRTSGKGLHAQTEYQQCQNCHVEHQGREFALIQWKGGEKSFDHSLTGFRLEGKHGSLQCRQCHREQYITDLRLGPNERVDSSRTYLGLQAACSSCHQDEHRGQLGAECTKCHDQMAWKPAPSFNHATADFQLTGKHQAVSCTRCHMLMTDRPLGTDLSYFKFTNVPHGQCSSCHTDTHNGRLGDNCSGCHSTDGWRQVITANFDHSKTRYPLEGKHAVVACNKCHGASTGTAGMRFTACRDCHSDFHTGEFAHRESKGACEECHSVNGFSPARFLMAQHDQTEYPLKGAHRAVACLACHTKATSSQEAKVTFAFASTRCQACHKDPHRGQVDKFVAVDGCEACHAVDTWNQVTYDHSKSTFALEGKHTKVACTKCHAEIASATEVTAVKFTGIRTDCQSCHTDIHRGQFASQESFTDCARCHIPTGWNTTKFDHASSRFKLDGAHRNVACGKCHVAVTSDEGSFVRYKPLETTCASCHGAGGPQRSS